MLILDNTIAVQFVGEGQRRCVRIVYAKAATGHLFLFDATTRPLAHYCFRIRVVDKINIRFVGAGMSWV